MTPHVTVPRSYHKTRKKKAGKLRKLYSRFTVRLQISIPLRKVNRMKDLSVLQDSPFTDQGSIVEVFTDLSVWAGIRKAIERVNANATVA